VTDHNAMLEDIVKDYAEVLRGKATEAYMISLLEKCTRFLKATGDEPITPTATKTRRHLRYVMISLINELGEIHD